MSNENPDKLDGRDLFGNPIEPIRDRRGRPSFANTKENQDFVAVRAAAGWSHSAIAGALGCDEKTLRKYFSRELSGGALIIEGMCLDVLLHKVREGHTPSVKALQARLDQTATPPAPKDKPAGAGDGDAAAKKMGKKDKQLADAGKPSAGYGELYDRMRRAQGRPQ